jgi:hypothetical protein
MKGGDGMLLWMRGGGEREEEEMDDVVGCIGWVALTGSLSSGPSCLEPPPACAIPAIGPSRFLTGLRGIK